MAKKPQITKNLRACDVKIPNTITRSAQGLSLAEKRLVFATVAKAGGKNLGDEIIITAAEYAATFEMPVDEAYQQLKTAAKNLRTRYFTLHEQDRNGKYGMKWEINWMSKVGYEDGLGKIGLRFGEDIRPHLENLRRQFTLYKLKQATSLRSVYSWRLLEMMERFKNKDSDNGIINAISVEDFCFSMEAPAAMRGNFGKLRSQIIEPAIKEVTGNDGWKIEFTYTKAGRKVDKLTFKYEKDPQGNLF